MSADIISNSLPLAAKLLNYHWGGSLMHCFGAEAEGM